MREWLTSWSKGQMILAGGALGAVVLVGLVLWLIFGAGPRRRRGFRRASRLLAQGKWTEAMERAPALRAIGSPNEVWQNRINDLEGQALVQGAAECLLGKDYESALTYGLRGARILNRSPLEARAQVQNAMLEEARRLFAANEPATATHELLERALRVQSPCREASFWQALIFLRENQLERAIEHLQRSRTGVDRPPDEEELPEGRGAPPAPPSPILEPPLYLGALALRNGQPKEALRYFTEANRLDATCPLVPLHVGCALIATGSDVQLAVRTLQKVLGSKGLGAWQEKPKLFWAEVYPEQRSYVRKLAIKHPFHCPLWGEGPGFLIRQGQLALAQGLQRLGQNDEAAKLFDAVLKDGAPTLPVLRGLGLAQARVGKFDEAYKALRQAHDLENPKDRLTSGYLALCAIKAKGVHVADGPSNATWALQTILPFSAPGDGEWVDLISQVFAEARGQGIPLGLDEQLYLCEHLASVHAADAKAAAAFQQIHRDHANVFRPEYAWLYAQAIAQHGGGGPEAAQLFEMALHDRPTVQAYFAERDWDLDAVERVFLERCALANPGQLPTILGSEGPARAEKLLFAWSKAREAAGNHEAAAAALETFIRLVPNHPPALDHLAGLHYRVGRIPQAITTLIHWQKQQPHDPMPLVRLALLRAGMNETDEALGLLHMAQGLAQGPARAEIAWLGARVALHQWASSENREPSEPGANTTLSHAEEFVTLTLADNPTHADALTHLIALKWLKNDIPGLASLAGRVTELPESEPSRHYFAALAQLAAENWQGMAASSQKATASANGSPLALEAAYLEGVARAELGELKSAAEILVKPASHDDCLAAPFAQGLLGSILWQQGRFDEASTWWQKVPAAQRTAWKLTETLGGTQLLAALEAFHAGQFEAAADKFRLAGKLGCRDRRLGGLLLASLVKAGQQAARG